MKCVFRNPCTKKLEIGVIYKRLYTPKGKKYHVVNELGSLFTHLPSKESKGPTESGYVDFELTQVIIPHVETNLNIDNQGNYRDKNFIPAIRKFSVQ